MKKSIILFFITNVLVLLMLVLGCTQGGGSSGGGSGSGGGDDDGDGEIVVTGSINYQTLTIPEIINFSMGYTGIETPVHIVPSISSFKMGKYEVTYEQWYIVRQWAISNGYTIKELGMEGNSGNQSTPSARKLEPVTMINWRDAIVWCNAASQYEGLKPVYYTDAGFTKPIKVSTFLFVINSTPGSEDNPYVNWSANGYRLPTEAEWEATARYRNGTTWLRGDAPSGWADNNPFDGDWRIEKGVDWYENNAGDNYKEVNAVAWWASNSGSVTQKVGTKNANNLVIYDMSGNVYEWCWNWYGNYVSPSPYYTVPNPKGPITDPINTSNRILRGGCWNLSTFNLRVSSRYNNNPSAYDSNIGFRLARSN